MSYKINPCKVCMKKFDSDINQCCYETLNAFEGTGSINSIRNSPLEKNCIDCVKQAIKKSGKNPCDLKLSPPVLCGNVSHYFPILFNKIKNVEQAGVKCKQMCLETNLKMNVLLIVKLIWML